MCARENEAKIEQYAKKAVQLAIEGRWDEAVTANKQILEISPRDVESCNRLGRAFIELGQYAAAREAYEKTLQSDPYNAIAKKNLKRLSKTGESASKDDHHKVVTDVFIEETGKARVVGLIHMAPKEIIARMAPAEQVDLRVDGQRLIAEDDNKQYLGEIDPKYASRLTKLIAGGNRYIAAISRLGENLQENEVKILIREVYQHPSQAGRLSFPLDKSERFRPYVRESLLRQRAEDEATEEAEEAPETDDMAGTNP